LLAGWLFWTCPLNETNEPFGLDLRLGVIAPGCLLLVGHLQIWRMARRKDWPAAPPAPRLLPLLMAALALALFVRSNYLQPESGTLRAVLSLDETSGAVLWQTTVFVSPAERKHALNSFATATPASDGERVYADFGGGLAALDRDGRLLWLIRDPDYPRYLRYGAGSSPVLAGDLLIVYHDREWLGHGDLDQPAEAEMERRPSTLTAYDKFSGEERWRVTPSFSHASYMTPFVWQHDDRSEVVISTWKTLAGFDLATGALQWQHPHAMLQMVPSLVAGDDWLITCGGNALPHQVAAVRPPSLKRAGETLWTSKLGGPAITSPVCWKGMLFSVSRTGILFCRDATTGHEFWRQRLEGRFLASLLAGDDHVYALNTDGTMFVVAAASEATEPVVNQFDEPCAATPAIANGCLFVRSPRHLTCIGGSN
jgi:outer membrane protein assembly factor BamB